MAVSHNNVGFMLFCSLLFVSTALAADAKATPSAPKDFYNPPTPSTPKPPTTTPTKPYTPPSVAPPNPPVVTPPVTPYPPKAPTPSVGIKPPVTPYPPKSPSPIVVVKPPVALYPPKGPSPPAAPYPPMGPSPPLAPSPPSPAPYYGSLPPVKKEECAPLCGTRCSKHSRLAVCMRACSTCCTRCKCVPPGTYGNQKLCGRCYADMTTHGGRLKCP